MIDTKTERLLGRYGDRFGLEFSRKYGATLIRNWRERRKIVEYMMKKGFTSPKKTIGVPELSDRLEMLPGTVRCLMRKKQDYEGFARMSPSDFAKSWGAGYYIEPDDGIFYLNFLGKLGV